MKTNNMNLPANCSVLSEEEMLYINGGFQLNTKVIALGLAVIAVGAMGLNMLSWATGASDTNFIQDSINAGQNFIDGSVSAGQDLLDGMMGK